jgi:hypothetical protein
MSDDSGTSWYERDSRSASEESAPELDPYRPPRGLEEVKLQVRLEHDVNTSRADSVTTKQS